MTATDFRMLEAYIPLGPLRRLQLETPMNRKYINWHKPGRRR